MFTKQRSATSQSTTRMALDVLTALDRAKTQYYHFKAIMIAGMGLFTDAYNLFTIAPVTNLIGRVYYSEMKYDGKPGVMSPIDFGLVFTIALLGTVVGQLVFGFLGDRVGRRKVYGMSLLIMVVSSLGSGLSVCRTRKCMLITLCFFRFWVGVGIGGDYPLSATIMSEFANTNTRGSFIAAVFSMQGLGIFASSAVTMVLTVVVSQLATDKSEIGPIMYPEEAVNILWRVILMIGAVPAALTFYWRMGMPETARYTALVENNVNKANKDIARVLSVDIELNTIDEDEDVDMFPPETYSLFSKQFLKNHGRDLFACSISWLLVDIPFYSNNFLQSEIYRAKFAAHHPVNPYTESYNIAKSQAILAAVSIIPGYWAAIYFIDRVGRRKIQMMGFFFMAIFLLALGVPYSNYWYHHHNYAFIVLYSLAFFFANFGPNTTTFIVPAELFPAQFRSTCHGIAGGVGKIGAMIGAIGFLWASKGKGDEERADRGWMMYALVILGCVCGVGVVITYLFTRETMGRSLEENEGGGGNYGGGE